MSNSFKNKVADEYFLWLYNKVCQGRAHDEVSFNKILSFLHQTEFTFTVPKDINRAKDGEDLRYHFAVTNGYDPYVLENDEILTGPCSVLEMMVALAVRCEESIMYDTKYGNRTGQWFWEMMANLGIGYMTDERFDRREAEYIVYNFLDRCYSPDGKGGLFYIRNCKDDLRDVEIWAQLCWYLGECD